jgi:hypothetical protein
MIKLFYARHAYSLGIGKGLLRARLVRLRPAGAGADQDGPQLWKARTAIRTSAQHPGDVGQAGQLAIDDGTLQCAEADRKADADDRPRIGLGGTCRHSTNKGDSDARLNGSTKPLRQGERSIASSMGSALRKRTTAGIATKCGIRRLASIWFSVVVPSQTCRPGWRHRNVGGGRQIPNP